MAHTPHSDHSHDHGHDHAHGHGHPHGHVSTAVNSDAELLDPANQSLSDALRRSFGVLKLLMVVMVVLYLLSGWFSVKPGEEGFIVRFGRIVGTAKGERYMASTLGPGWHWSWPYPFEQWQTVNVQERRLPVEFMFLRTDAEKATGKLEYKYDNRLNPQRDDYLITGDVNIIHATLVINYRIKNSIDYITHVFPSGRPSANDVRGGTAESYPEYNLMRDMARSAVVEVAAAMPALDIRGSGQSKFLEAVGARLELALKRLADAGTPLGIEIDARNGVLAAKSGSVEAILPPRQVQEDFDKVIAEENKKSRTIAEAAANARQVLTETAGERHKELSEALDDEFTALLAVSAARTGSSAEASNLTALREDLAKKRERVETLLDASTGQAQAIIQLSRIYNNQIVSEARSDHDQIRQLKADFDREPQIVLSRLRDDMFAEALTNSKVAKWYVPRGGELTILNINRSKISNLDALKNQGPAKSPTERQRSRLNFQKAE